MSDPRARQWERKIMFYKTEQIRRQQSLETNDYLTMICANSDKVIRPATPPQMITCNHVTPSPSSDMIDNNTAPGDVYLYTSSSETDDDDVNLMSHFLEIKKHQAMNNTKITPL